ncbi:response regulator [Magnetospirillum gryphiswaldense]|uniref:PAS n=1 Tax=Magnetospirillum gryphiswaldense TaxID=55518 RepID=A4TVQ8_9PROT|nr:response regulator [Magnetospirillum gryphiswaldense]AVM75245.1 Sensor histidine kinase RcsC [Magnetospirillum gryphiswaldense MSR-1]AVM79148.1 Sensor histidine kinase RcsC [Magnetospirillum gryphiswaldense]CAM74715.1 PAS [Magnetospirillum gryphiswaldense MSR-1]
MNGEKRALVVDDNDVNRMLAGRLLNKAGWVVDMAEDGAQALDWLEGNRVDLVLLDISMPGLSGEDVCRTVRARQLCQGAKVVAYTAHAMPEEREQFLACGFDAILTKPISKAGMQDLLNTLGLGS